MWLLFVRTSHLSHWGQKYLIYVAKRIPSDELLVSHLLDQLVLLTNLPYHGVPLDKNGHESELVALSPPLPPSLQRTCYNNF